ncbi:MAG: septum formation protein Maf [Lachnospiraceae bacterium]|nr:septum formation protein Maf [Lachnospiraceae bacterium]
MKIILASESPRRKDLLQQIGMEFSVLSCGGEVPVEIKIPEEVAKEHALQKAEAVAENILEEAVIIGADTVVAFQGEILEKPTDRQDAINMLTKLQGNTHEVYTGVVLIKIEQDGTKNKKKFHECTKVTFYPMSKEEIEEYVDTKEPMDKAGSYGIQGIAAKYIREITGDYNNVVGLPVARVYQELKEF